MKRKMITIREFWCRPKHMTYVLFYVALPTGLMVTTLASCVDSREKTIIPQQQIREISGPDDLAVENPNITGKPKPIRAIEGKKIAHLQAKAWNNGAALILVCQKFTSISKNAALAWLYVYKNEANDSWLGVTVGSQGVIDAGVKKSSKLALAFWPAISDWRVDESLQYPNNYDFCELVVSSSPNASQLREVWIESRESILLGGVIISRIIDANTGKEATDVEKKHIESEFEFRPKLWSSIKTSATY